MCETATTAADVWMVLAVFGGFALVIGVFMFMVWFTDR